MECVEFNAHGRYQPIKGEPTTCIDAQRHEIRVVHGLRKLFARHFQSIESTKRKEMFVDEATLPKKFLFWSYGKC